MAVGASNRNSVMGRQKCNRKRSPGIERPSRSPAGVRRGSSGPTDTGNPADGLRCINICQAVVLPGVSAQKGTVNGSQGRTVGRRQPQPPQFSEIDRCRGYCGDRHRAGRARGPAGCARGRPRRRAGAAHRERPPAQSDDRAARHAARRAAHARRHDRQQARLRSRHLRRLHHARRRPPGLRVLDARDRRAGQADSQRRRAGQRHRRCIRCSRRSATRTP